MGRFRDVASWLLLVTFVAGGLLGPSLHRVHHTLERAAQESCHPDAVHDAEIPLWGEEEAPVTAAHCTLCVTRLLVVLPSLKTLTSPRILGTPSMERGTHLAAVQVFAHRTIRGPPVLS